MNYQVQFYEWLQQNNKSKQTISKYIRNIKKISEEFGEHIGKELDLFQLSNPAKIERIKIDYLSVKDFREKDKKRHRENSSAISSYKAFLEDLGNDTMPMPIPLPISPPQNRRSYDEKRDITEKELKTFDPFSKKNQIKKGIYIERLVRDSNLALKLKELYNYKCQLCERGLKSSKGYICEAHHIKPYNKKHKGDDCWENMVVLCPNCHSQFDDLFYAIHPDNLTVHCLDKQDPHHLKELKNAEGHEFNKSYLNYTWNIFEETHIK